MLKTLNVGYIGATKQNIPNSPEGWGYKIGILAEELQKYGITDIKFVGFPNGPDLSESLISGRLDIGMLGDTPAKEITFRFLNIRSGSGQPSDERSCGGTLQKKGCSCGKYPLICSP
ncbi:hypothetical protein ACFQWB_16600 [Paenibacillus thermoaerophilus]|uniref:Uncharacterized protein n=1 Tax=Paenibacillus thermoaerophilus TaxID=1215385 RepID=A0ABW2V7J5_9BACL|nr:hypothetical protein [Paenibacillus thermoaerophilus]